MAKTRQERKALGSFYTPPDMARRVTERALQPLMCSPQAMQCPCCSPSVCLTNLLVIDPACGDGVFLSAAADILGELLRQAYALEGIECSREEARARVVANCLVGVDIDPEAIAAARLRLGDECELECRDALLDWEFDTDGRPTAFVGNPPYLGGRKIGTVLGADYQKRLVAEFTPKNGGADLCAYFLLLAAHTLETGGSMGTTSYICTNTISQGDTREVGLGWLLQKHRDVIYCAEKALKWPGDASVMCSIVHLANEALWREIGERDAWGVEYVPWLGTRPNNARGSTILERSSRSKSCERRPGLSLTPRRHTGCGPTRLTAARCPTCAKQHGPPESMKHSEPEDRPDGGGPAQPSLFT